MTCKKLCDQYEISCPVKECRYWIDYENDLNCTLTAVENNGQMTLMEVAARLDISYVRVKQIEDKARDKLNKRLKRHV